MRESCPCCNLPLTAPKFSLCCDLRELSELGAGFPMYFYFVKNALFMLVLVLLMQCQMRRELTRLFVSTASRQRQAAERARIHRPDDPRDADWRADHEEEFLARYDWGPPIGARGAAAAAAADAP